MRQGLTIYFVRHGETYFNLNGRTQGWCDPLLTPGGVRGVQQMGQGLKHLRFDCAIVSDLGRTRRTAEIILQENDYPSDLTPIVEMPEFREISFGSFEGDKSEVTWQAMTEYLGYDSIEEMLASTTEVERLRSLKGTDPLGQAEDYQSYCQHIDAGIQHLLSAYGELTMNILFVGHSINIRYILAQLIPESDHIPAFFDMYSLSNGGVTVINNDGGPFRLLTYNNTQYLTE